MKIIENLKELKYGSGYLIYQRHLDDTHECKRLVLFTPKFGKTILTNRDDGECIYDLMTDNDFTINPNKCLKDFIWKVDHEIVLYKLTDVDHEIVLYKLTDDEFAHHIIAEVL